MIGNTSDSGTRVSCASALTGTGNGSTLTRVSGSSVSCTRVSSTRVSSGLVSGAGKNLLKTSSLVPALVSTPFLTGPYFLF
jgi:hypothetical protein